jgi:hypothetical protein
MIRTLATLTTWIAITTLLVVSGGYTVHYLLTWQWTRAEFAAIGFVACMVFAATLLVLTRIRQLEERLAGTSKAVSAAAPTGAPTAAPTTAPVDDGEPRPRFDWLTATPLYALAATPFIVVLAGTCVLPALDAPRPMVFIPIFLASGMVVAALASVVERLAARRTHARALPAARRGMLATIGLALAVIVVGAGITGLVFRGAHYWGSALGPGRTHLVLDVRHQGPTPGTADVAATMGRYCSLQSGVPARYRGVEPLAGGRVVLTVSPALDDEAVTRFAGCLQDAVVGRHSIELLTARAVLTAASPAEDEGR